MVFLWTVVYCTYGFLWTVVYCTYGFLGTMVYCTYGVLMDGGVLYLWCFNGRWCIVPMLF